MNNRCAKRLHDSGLHRPEALRAAFGPGVASVVEPTLTEFVREFGWFTGEFDSQWGELMKPLRTALNLIRTHDWRLRTGIERGLGMAAELVASPLSLFGVAGRAGLVPSIPVARGAGPLEGPSARETLRVPNMVCKGGR